MITALFYTFMLQNIKLATGDNLQESEIVARSKGYLYEDYFFR